MNRYLNAISISLKLPVFMVLLTIGGIATTGLISYSNAERTLRSEAELRLAGVADLKGAAFLNYLDAIDRDLTIMAQNPTTIDALDAFAAAYAQIPDATDRLQRTYIDDNPHPLGEKDRLEAAGDGTVYDAVHRRYHPFFHLLQARQGYYDIFLFDTAGDLIYTVFKELDFATNLVTGRWKDTGLGEVTARGGDRRRRSFGIRRFRALCPEPRCAGLVHRPSGVRCQRARIGVVAYQMPIGAINAIMQDAAGLGETGDAFVVGADGLMRTDPGPRSTASCRHRSRTPPSRRSPARGGGRRISRPGRHAHLHRRAALEFLGTRWAAVARGNREVFAPLTVRNAICCGPGRWCSRGWSCRFSWPATSCGPVCRREPGDATHRRRRLRHRDPDHRSRRRDRQYGPHARRSAAISKAGRRRRVKTSSAASPSRTPTHRR
ncbi:MAG: hypothetical protein R3D80_04050 [Paracoccaceae bacterium]